MAGKQKRKAKGGVLDSREMVGVPEGFLNLNEYVQFLKDHPSGPFEPEFIEVWVARHRDYLTMAELAADTGLSFEQYVEFKKAHPGGHIEPASIDTFAVRHDFVVGNCSTYGIDRVTAENALHPDIEPSNRPWMDEFVLELLVALLRRRRGEKEGKSHLVRRHKLAPLSFLNEAALQCLEACDARQEQAPPHLAVLFRELLARPGEPAAIPQQPRARNLAALILAGSHPPSDSKIAALVGVNRSTVLRWKRDPAFAKQVAKLGHFQGAGALVKALSRKKKGMLQR